MKLPIREAVFEVFQFLWENRLDLLHMVAAPVLALSIFHIALAALFSDNLNAASAQGTMSTSYILAVIFSSLFSTVFYVMFAVAWHRRCLKSEEQTTIWTALRWDWRKTLFLYRFFLISIISVACVLPVVVIAAIVGGTGAVGAAAGGAGPGVGVLILQVAKLIFIFVVMLVQVRLSLLLPATAIDQKMTLMEAWAIGRGNSWRMLGLLLMSIAPAMLFAILVASAMGAIAQATGLSGTLTFQFVGRLVSNFAYYIVIATSVSALSVSYRYLRRPPSFGMPYQM